MADKVRENLLRRHATRLGLMLKKSHGNLWQIHDKQGYMLLNAEYRTVAAGPDYELTLDDVAAYLALYETELKEAQTTKTRG